MILIQDYKSFLETRTFTRIWNAMGLTDGDLLRLQLNIIAAPDSAPVVQGCGGVRKVRFTSAGSSKGKSGSYRCVYRHLKTHGIIVLILAYPKSKQENISETDKKRIAALLAEIENDLK